MIKSKITKFKLDPKGGPAIRCLKCKDIIQSTFVHDFKSCKCEAIFIDGGAEYTRFGGQVTDIEYLDPEEQKKWLESIKPNPLRNIYNDLGGLLNRIIPGNYQRLAGIKEQVSILEQEMQMLVEQILALRGAVSDLIQERDVKKNT